MAWIESHQDLARHPKTIRLARLLGVSLPQVIGHLHLLWWWALDFAQDGDLTGWEPADIATVAQYDGDPDTFVDALLTCGRDGQAGFLERLPDGRLVIHDWHEYAGKYAQQRQRDAERKRRSRQRISVDNPPDIRRTSGGQIPESVRNHNQNPNLNQPEEEEEEAPPAAHPLTWIRWYEQQTTQLPSRREMADAQALVQRGVTEELLIEVTRRAIEAKKRQPASYAIRVLANLVPYGVRTVEDWNRFESEQKQQNRSRDAPNRERIGFDALMAIIGGGESA